MKDRVDKVLNTADMGTKCLDGSSEAAEWDAAPVANTKGGLSEWRGAKDV